MRKIVDLVESVNEIRMEQCDVTVASTVTHSGRKKFGVGS